MKKIGTAVALLSLSLPVMVQAMEFQTPGTLGMGRAGVARTNDAYATFINPAGLAFYKNAFNMKFNAGVGVAVSSSLADNIDKIGKLSGTDLNYDSTAAGFTAQDAANATASAAQFAGVLKDLDSKKGDLALNVDLALAFQFRSYGLGIYGMSEVGAGVGNVDLINIRAGDTGTTTTVTQLATDIGAVTTPASTTGTAAYFSQTEYNNLVTAIVAADLSAATQAAKEQQARDLVTKLETELKAGGVNTTGMTPDQIAQGLAILVPTLAPTAPGGVSNSIDNNNTTVLLRGIAIAEVPLAYGHKFDLGNFGKLGIGAAAKVMRGTVYSTDVKVKELKDSADVADRVKDNKADSTQFGIDLGALWRMEEVKYIGPISVGLAAKNLNTPKFDGPKDPATLKVSTIKVEPQVRLGLGLEPFSWLSLVADMDMTKNKTVIPGRDSQLIGGGLEAHFDHWYTLWLALRAGAYKNIGETGSKPVITAGLSLGPKYLRLDINGAMATAKGTYDGKSVPLEGKVEFGLSTAFF